MLPWQPGGPEHTWDWARNSAETSSSGWPEGWLLEALRGGSWAGGSRKSRTGQGAAPEVLGAWVRASPGEQPTCCRKRGVEEPAPSMYVEAAPGQGAY